MKIFILEYNLSQYKKLNNEDAWNADVYDIGDNKVLKRIHKNISELQLNKLMKYYQFLMKNPHQNIVKIFNVTKDGAHLDIITEKLYKINYKYKRLILALISAFLEDGGNSDLFDVERIKYYSDFFEHDTPNEKQMKFIIKKTNELLKAYLFIAKNKLYGFENEYLDIHGGNIMKDKNNVENN